MKAFDAGRHPWFVAQIVSREERDVIADMERICRVNGIEIRTYAPYGRREVKNHRTHRYQVREFAVFPGYVFVSLSGGRLDVIRDCIVRYLGGDGPLAILPAEIQEIYNAEVNGDFDDMRQSKKDRLQKLEEKFPVGAELRVVDGCFIGLSAVVKQVTGLGRIAALVELFGRKTPVEFERKQLQAS